MKILFTVVTLIYLVDQVTCFSSTAGVAINKIHPHDPPTKKIPFQYYPSSASSTNTALWMKDRHHQQQRRRFNDKTNSRNNGLQASTVVGNNNGGDGGMPALISSSVEKIKVLATKFIHNIKNDEVTQWRCAALVFVSSLCIFHQRIDFLLVKLWTYLTTSSHCWATWFRHDRTCL
jgi:hypothetical protein